MHPETSKPELKETPHTLADVLPLYPVETRPAIVRWFDRLPNARIVKGPFITNRAMRRAR